MTIFNRLYLSSASLIVSNLFVLYAVYALNWTAYQVLFLFWLESGVVGFINLFKIAIAEGPKDNREDKSFMSFFNARILKITLLKQLNKEWLLLTFLSTYSIFMYGTWKVLVLYFKPPQPFLFSEALVKILAFIMVSHVISFMINFIGKQEYKYIGYVKQAVAPYSRIVVLYLTLLVSVVIAANFLYEPTQVLWFLVFFKIVFDLNAHIKQHKSVYVSSMEDVPKNNLNNSQSTS